MMRKQEIKIRKLFDLVINDYRDNKRKSLSTLANQIDNHLEPFFGERSAERLRVSDVEEYKDQRKNEGAKNATINLELAALRRAYSLGAEKELVNHRPKIKLYNIGKSNRRIGFFEHDEFERQLEALPPYAKLVLRFGYFCGWREGELFKLTWTENYDESGQIIRLNDSKNGNGRVLPLRDDEGLNECGLVIEGAKQNRVKNCPYIFHIDGKPIQRGTFHRHWRRACKLSEVNRHFHDLRRTAVRNLTRAGIHRTIAKMITGHETDDVFERYDIVDEADLRKGLSQLYNYMTVRAASQGTTRNGDSHAVEATQQKEANDSSASVERSEQTKEKTSNEPLGLLCDRVRESEDGLRGRDGANFSSATLSSEGQRFETHKDTRVQAGSTVETSSEAGRQEEGERDEVKVSKASGSDKPATTSAATPTSRELTKPDDEVFDLMAELGVG